MSGSSFRKPSWKPGSAHKKRAQQSLRPLLNSSRFRSGELVHRVVFTACLEGSVTGEVLLVVIADIGSRHILVLDARDALTNFLALHMEHVAQHAQITEV